MIKHLTTLIENFPGAANQTHCFTHILNLVAKSILCQFEAPKLKRRNALDDTTRELATIFHDLENDDMNLNNDAESDGGGNEDSGEGDDNVDDDMIDDDDDGLLDEWDGVSEEELASIEKCVKLVQLVLTKVCHINSNSLQHN